MTVDGQQANACEVSRASQQKSTDIDNVLPSPAPSDEHRPENTSVVDLDQVQSPPLGPDSPFGYSDDVDDSTLIASLKERFGSLEAVFKYLESLGSANLVTKFSESHGGLNNLRECLSELAGQRDISTKEISRHPSTSRQTFHDARGEKRALTASANRPQRLAGENSLRPQSDNITTTNTTTYGSNGPHDSPRSSPPRPSLLTTYQSSIDANFNHWLVVLRGAKQTQDLQSQAGKMTLSRFGLLEDSLHQRDYFYLLLHQIYCLSNQCPEKLREVCRGFSEVHLQGLSVLRQLLMDNAALEARAVQWFQSFPLPIDLLLRSYNIFGTMSVKVLGFLEKFKEKWAQVREESKFRSSPPSAHEMSSVFGLESTVLQSVLYRAIHRSIWVGSNDKCYLEGESGFFSNQRDVLLYSAESARLQRLREDFVTHQRQLMVYHQTHCCVTRDGAAQSQQQQGNQGIQVLPFPPHPHTGFPRQESRHGRPSLNINARPSQPTRSMVTGVRTVPSLSPTHFSPAAAQTHSPAPLMNTLSRSQTTQLPPSPAWSQAAASPRVPDPMGPISWFSRAIPGGSGLVDGFNSQPTNAMARSPGNSHVVAPQSFNSSPNATATVTRNFINYGPPSQPSPMQQPAPYLLMPEVRQPPQATTHSSVHQAHVRSPILEVAGRTDLATTPVKYFTYIKDVTLIPQSLHIHKRHLSTAINLSREDVESLVVTTRPEDGSRPRRVAHLARAFTDYVVSRPALLVPFQLRSSGWSWIPSGQAV